jgi:ABC-type nitrate/sulfonate/bicarbonate transport system substrate-binding protein
MQVKRFAVLALSALLCVAAFPMAAQAQKVSASLRLDWVPGPHHIGPILAAQRGYYGSSAWK